MRNRCQPRRSKKLGSRRCCIFLSCFRADPDIPEVWYQLGLKLTKIPGYKALASVWLDAYLLAVPNASNATEIREQIQQLGAASEPRAEGNFVNQLEVIALYTRAEQRSRVGQRELAIADFRRVLELDATQDDAREALRQLSRAQPTWDVNNPTIEATELAALSCDELWFRRNAIFKALGYCFKTPRAIARFGNAGCTKDDDDQVSLNSVQKAFVDVVKSIETSKQCSP